MEAARFDNSGVWLALLKISTGTAARTQSGVLGRSFRTELHIWQTQTLEPGGGEVDGCDEWTRRFTDVVEDVCVPERPSPFRGTMALDPVIGSPRTERSHSLSSRGVDNDFVPLDLKVGGSEREGDTMHCVVEPMGSSSTHPETPGEAAAARASDTHRDADVIWHDDSTHLCVSFFSQNVASVGRKEGYTLDAGASGSSPKGYKKRQRRKRRRRGGYALVFYKMVPRGYLAHLSQHMGIRLFFLSFVCFSSLVLNLFSSLFSIRF